MPSRNRIPTLTRHALNRTTLARQLLLARSTAHTTPEAVAHLGALQAQEANSPYLSLWARLDGFAIADLTAALEERSVVRSTVLRGTQHIVTAADFPWMRGLVQRKPDGGLGLFTKAMSTVDRTEFVDEVRRLLKGRTMTRPALRDELRKRWPDVDPLALAWVSQSLVPVVHPPPSGTWNRGGATPFVLAEEWLGTAVDTAAQPESIVDRYLRAYGPASVKDVQAWSGLTRLRDVMARMDLRTYRDENGRELYDVPDGVLSEVDDAPVRFLPYFDNLIVAYDDRSRLMSAAVRARVCVGAVIYPTVLVGGRVRATWRVEGKRDLVVTPFGEDAAPDPLSADETGAVEAEGARLLAFMELGGGIVFE